MFGLNSRYRICDLFGIPIYISTSFIFLLVLFVLDMHSFGYGLAVALMLAISVTAHELGHALTARAFGYHTNDITLSLLGGCASLIALPRKAYQEFLVAVAGPLVSFGLSALVFLVDVFQIPVYSPFLRFCFAYLFWMNIVLGVFNLLPGFPMDGGRIFRSVMRLFTSRAKATFVAMWVGRVTAVFVGLRGLAAMFNGGGFGFISVLIAWMIWKEGYREYLLARREEDFRNWTQDDFSARVSPPPYDC